MIRIAATAALLAFAGSAPAQQATPAKPAAAAPQSPVGDPAGEAFGACGFLGPAVMIARRRLLIRHEST